jgi:teichuronic acid biosynthesis glycosyltransferase TuaC
MVSNSHLNRAQTPKPRVLFVVPGDGSGSSMIFIRRQIDSLRSARVIGAEFYLATRTSPGTLLRERRRFRRMVRDFAPDVIHAQYGTVTACFCLLSTRLPVVVTFRGSDLNPCRSISQARSLAGRLLSQLAALGAGGNICVSKQLRSRLWWRRESAYVIPSGVDTSVFHPRPRDEARAELDWPMDERVILFNAGRDPVTKGIGLARRAADIAGGSLDKLRLQILDGHVPPDRIPVYLNAADCLLVTSLFEGSPNVVKEAIACNLPVLSVDVGDVSERLRHVEPSAIVDADHHAIARGLVKVLLSPVRSNGSRRVGEISTTAMARRILGVYRAVLPWNYFLRPNTEPVRAGP